VTLHKCLQYSKVFYRQDYLSLSHKESAHVSRTWFLLNDFCTSFLSNASAVLYKTSP
jgi:hypothetical protein